MVITSGVELMKSISKHSSKGDSKTNFARNGGTRKASGAMRPAIAGEI